MRYMHNLMDPLYIYISAVTDVDMNQVSGKLKW